MKPRLDILPSQQAKLWPELCKFLSISFFMEGRPLPSDWGAGNRSTSISSQTGHFRQTL